MLALLRATMLFLVPILGCPPPFVNRRATNGTQTSAAKAVCQTAYPSSLQMLNSRYPNSSYAPTHFFMLARQASDTLQVAMQMQFTGLPPNITCCRLDLVLAAPDFGTIRGPQPIFDVFGVEREINAPATWETYEGDANGTQAKVFGTVNGQSNKLEEVRKGNKTVTVGSRKCNDTLTFQLGMKFDGGQEVNYWDFTDVAPPAVPVQGWRIVHSC
jgi:hypothetical protein